jgi:glutamate-1-semialdehyde 2,1-aminomutase
VRSAAASDASWPGLVRAESVGSKSAKLFERALQVMPGGVNSPVRAMRAVGRDPLFIDRAHGAEIVDVDGRSYVDYVCSWGPLVLGHARPEVVEAVTEAAARGTSYGAPTEAEVSLAEAVIERVPSAEMVRLVSSGTEAVMTALRLARAATGRELVLKFSGGYHGHVDGLLAEAGSGLATQGIPASPGVTRAQAAATIVARWNDVEGFESTIAAAGTKIAAVIAEPVPANMGVVPPREGFLELIRERCTDSGALLVLDEVITGFRVARGGAQERYGVQPDITVLGKVLGGGLPLAAAGGPRALMEQLAPAGEVYQAGTLSGNPLATAAGLATLRLLDQDAYDRLEAITARIANGVAEAASEAGVAVRVSSLCGLMTVFFASDPVESYEDALSSDRDAYGRFFRTMLERGVYLPPSPFEAWFPSLAHDDVHVGRTVDAAAVAFASLRE